MIRPGELEHRKKRGKRTVGLHVAVRQQQRSHALGILEHEQLGEAGVSARHLSCIETGKAQPSREMISKLANALEGPLRPSRLLTTTFRNDEYQTEVPIQVHDVWHDWSVTIEELRIESMFPADDETAEICHSLAAE